MILFHNRLYVADDLARSKGRVIKKLKQGKLQTGVFVITLPLGDSDMLEIYPSYIFLQKAFKKTDVIVVGLAGEQASAFSLIEQMLNDCLAKHNNADIKGYFEQEMD